MKYLIVGLGNPGNEYAETRHNIGFKVADSLAADLEGSYSLGKLADVAQLKHKGRLIIAIKPNTYMNLSGKAVQYWLTTEKIPLENLLVISDDIALPFGQIRLKGKGSDGGHNGLKDIQNTLHTQEFARLRFGVGNNFFPGKQADYVLGKWANEEKEQLDERIRLATDVVKSFVSIGLPHTMSLFNNK